MPVILISPFLAVNALSGIVLSSSAIVALPFMKAIDSARNEDGLINRTWQNFKAPFADKGRIFDYIKDDHGHGGDIPGRVVTTALVPLIGVANIPVSIAKATYDTATEMYDNCYKEVAMQTEGTKFLDKELQSKGDGNLPKII